MVSVDAQHLLRGNWLPVKSYFILQQGRATEMFYSFDKRSYRFASFFCYRFLLE